MKRRAFTLLEMMLVMAIIVVLATLVAPSFQAFYPGFQVSGAADNLKGAFERTRAHAIDTGIPYRFAVVRGGSHYRSAPDIKEYWETGEMGESSASHPVIQNVLPKGIHFDSQNGMESSKDETTSDPVDLSKFSTLVTFLPDGTARAETVDQSEGAARGFVEVRLWTSGTSPLYVTIRTLTGAIKIQRTSSQEEGP